MNNIRLTDLFFARSRLEQAIAKQVEIVARYKAHGSADEQFQRLFMGFFKVRRNAAWRAEYFKLFAKYEVANDGLFQLLWDLYKATGNVEASFATKMLAMIDPDRPIWDSYVLKNLGIKPPPQYLDHGIRIGMICDKMETISKAYERLATRPDMLIALKWMDANFPLARQLSKMKKMDFVVWSRRTGKNKIKSNFKPTVPAQPLPEEELTEEEKNLLLEPDIPMGAPSLASPEYAWLAQAYVLR